VSAGKKCSFCDALLQDGACELAAYERTVDGKEHLFCCKNCASKVER